MRIEVDLPNTPDHELSDGMYGYVTIHLRKAPRPQFMLPSKTVHEGVVSKQRYVYVVRDKHAHRVNIQIGPDDGKLVGVMSGLNVDDLVVIQDNGLLREGTEVEPELVTPPPPRDSQRDERA
jgi:hypothetical protein